jgi:two-component system, chemotaxis family, chemotaxis protein CheY
LARVQSEGFSTRILLVDDSSSVHTIVRGMLASIQVTDIVEARDGVDAIGRATSDLPNLIISDWNMPNMDGLTLVSRLRSMGYIGPIIMLTTESEKARVIQAVKAGVNNYIIKPFTPDLFYSRLRQTFETMRIPLTPGLAATAPAKAA